MLSQQVVPGDLADITPGAPLSAALAGIDLTRLSGFDCVEVLKARYRQLNHDRAQVMAAMVEVGLRGRAPAGDQTRMAVPDEFSADEIRAALMLTRRAADAQLDLAYDLITRLPAVHAAMDAGRLDEPRARVLSEWTTELSPEQARWVCDALLPMVSTLTTGQLIEKIKKMAIAIDPAWAQRRYEQAVAERKVVGYRNPDGSANLSGYNLPVDRVAAACGRIDALAKAVKHAGDARPIDHIRADLFLGMTDGTYTGLDDATILERLRVASRDQCPRDDGVADREDEPDHHDSGAGDPDGASGEGGMTAADGHAATDDPSSPLTPVGAGMELRARLSTLLGHDEYPGELTGWGPIHADSTRNLATLMSRGQWRFVITDEQGQLLNCGITTARPLGSARRSGSSREIVELQIPATALHELAGDSSTVGCWGPVIADLARQYANAQGLPDGDPTRRFPGSGLRRYIQIRDRRCVMIGCRAPARGTDADHTLDDACGGTTTEDNLGSVCRHDHRVKHDGGWRLDQPKPGYFRWWTRLGHTYLVDPPPIIEPLPDPIPRDGPALPLVNPLDHHWDDSGIWEDSPPGADPGPPPEPSPPPVPDDDPPPF
ncbi:MAG: DUF222 domain-containing protein [Pseudonocardiaceae bacterium]